MVEGAGHGADRGIPEHQPRRRRRFGRVVRRLLPLLVLGLALGAVVAIALPMVPRVALPAVPLLGSAPGPAPVEAPQPGTLRTPLAGVRTLDPGLAYDSSSIGVVQLLFEGLLAADPAGVLGPAGAESFEVSPDGRTYTFTLDPRSRWSDGRPVVAADYAFAWRRNVDPRTGSLYASALFPVRNAARIHLQGLPPELLGVRAADDRTLVVELEEPAPYFPFLVATWTYFPLREDVLQAYGDEWTAPGHLVGNGAFAVESLDRENGLVLRRSDTARQPAALDRIIFRTFPSAEAALDSYLAGELDVLPVSGALLDRVRANPALRAQLQTFPVSGTTFIVLNTRRSHLSDPRVRVALTLSLDRLGLVEQVLRYAGEPAWSVHPPDIPGRDPAPWAGDEPELAQRVLAAAGYPQGVGLPELTLAVGPGEGELGQFVASRWQQVLGVRVRVQEVTPFEAYHYTREWTERGDAYISSWQSDYPDPFNWFNLLWDSSQDRLQFNSGWVNAQFDQLVRAAARDGNPVRRVARYQEAEAILAQEAPVIPLYHSRVRYLVKPYVARFAPGRTGLSVPLLWTRVP